MAFINHQQRYARGISGIRLETLCWVKEKKKWDRNGQGKPEYCHVSIDWYFMHVCYLQRSKVVYVQALSQQPTNAATLFSNSTFVYGGHLRVTL
jgi:hypothetical protein